jgi:hypothetical protein
VIKTSVERVSQFYDTRQVRFSQSNLQKGPVLPIKNISKNFYAEQGYKHFFFKFEPVFTMPILENFRTAGLSLLVLKNWVLLFLTYKFIYF